MINNEAAVRQMVLDTLYGGVYSDMNRRFEIFPIINLINLRHLRIILCLSCSILHIALL